MNNPKPPRSLIPLLAAPLLSALCGPLSAADKPANTTPNIILIMCDDAGFADFGYTGGVSDTPVLDKLASQGMRFTRGYSNARCMPTRVSLMTGLNPQRSGEWGTLNAQCVTISEVLKEAGYATYMIGKWHLGYGKGLPKKRETLDMGLQSTPTGRGFDKFYGIWDGAAGVNKAKLMQAEKNGGFAPRIIDGDRPLELSEVPDDYYNTTTWTDKAIEFLKSTPADKPFFLYAAYTAPHWPLDPKPESLARYKGRFAEGWEVIRARIFENQKKLGLIPPNYPMPPLEHAVPPFSKEAEATMKYESGCEMYYASITEMDEQIGRLLETVKEMGRADNTIVVFISDNGADSVIGGFARGHVSNTPFMGYKLSYYEGGAVTPLLISWPGKVPANTVNTKQEIKLEDHMATFLELAGATYPTERNGQKIHPMDGRSYLKAIKDSNTSDPDRIWCWEHDGQRGVRAGDWNAVFVERRHPFPKKEYSEDRDGWNLYKVTDNNRVESEDLSASNPEKMKEMIGLWTTWAKSINWSPSPRFGLHPSDAANGIADFGKNRPKGPAVPSGE